MVQVRGCLCMSGIKTGALIQTRRSSSSTGDVPLYRLRSRALLQVKGQDTVQFLQGLVTSDVECLGSVMGAQYAMLLNVQGRVMYDLILYDVSHRLGAKAVLIECDRGLSDQLLTDIKKYKIRKKVSIDNVSDQHTVFATLSDHGGKLVEIASAVVETADPRVNNFGLRIITDNEPSRGVQEEDSGYHEERLKWGIPEGPQDLPPGNCFPLESNLVYMNGVSFSKGCYLGQELTARTYHTGVTRKRLMPLLFDSPPGNVEPGENIRNSSSKNVGKFRSCYGNHGLGLMRIGEITESDSLTVENKSGEAVTLKTVIPSWWPKVV